MTDNTATLDTFRQRVRQLLATAVPPDIQAARKQEGISVFLGGLAAPGVTVRPIKYIHAAPFHVQIFSTRCACPSTSWWERPTRAGTLPRACR